MSIPVFPQTVVAVIWDFDKTLLPGYMQRPLFQRFGVDEPAFWREVRGLERYYADRGHELVSADTIYLSHILTYVRAGKFRGLNNGVLRELGKGLELYPGLPEFFEQLKRTVETNPGFAKHEITLEHYVVSSGLRQTILGSAIAPFVEEVWACEFLEVTAQPGFLDSPPAAETEERELTDIAYAIDNTTKTRAIFEINKGVNKHPDAITVNDEMAHEDRRVPFENMIYVADGPSDVPVFSILNQYGGKTYAVYNPASPAEFRQVLALQEQRRVQGLGPADYSPGTHTARYLTTWVEQIAEGIQTRRERALGDRVGKPPRHIHEPSVIEAPQDAAAAKSEGAAPAPRDDDGARRATTPLTTGARPPSP